MNFRLQDPCFTNRGRGDPKFRRLQTAGLASWRYPEAFVTCCKALSDEEAGRFEEWLVCPQGVPAKNGTPVEVFCRDNEKTHALLLKENEARVAARGSQSQSDEKCPQ